MTKSVQPTLRWQLHLLRCCNSLAGVRIRTILKPSRKQMIPNLKRITIARSFYSAFIIDNRMRAPSSHASYTHFCIANLEMLSSHGVSNRRAVGSFRCFTCAARARELSCAFCCNGFHHVGNLFWRRLHLARRSSAAHWFVMNSGLGYQK